MKHLLVTGGAGRIGSVMVAHLRRKGYIVRAVDAVAKEAIQPQAAACLANVEYRQVDVSDYAAVRESCREIDGIIHLAGIPIYIAARSAEIFQVNAGGTFNLFEAAAQEGIQRVVVASSINYLGNGFGVRWPKISYFPVDEAHLGESSDTYAFSKQVLEETAAFFWRRARISSVCFRFPLVYDESWLTEEFAAQILRKNHVDYAYLMQLPEAERLARAQALKAHFKELSWRRSAGDIQYADLFQYFFTELGGMLLFGMENFWSVISVWDAARALELALHAPVTGCQPLYVSEPENSTLLPSQTLASLFYPEVTSWKRPYSGAESLLNSEKAEQLLNFLPQQALNNDAVRQQAAT